MLQEIELPDIPLSKYKDLIDKDTYGKIEKTAKVLAGLRIVHLNTSATGGGVAEILRSLVSLLNSMGLNAKWYLASVDGGFFTITKEIHNFLQGKKGILTEKDKATYLEINEKIAGELSKLEADVWVVHDPQFAATINSFSGLHPAIWRCHVDTSHPNPQVWDFLLPFIQKYDRYVFTIRKYLGSGLSYEKAKIIPPAIDPLNEKNDPLPAETANKLVSRFGVDPDKPLISQISRFDPWKDPWGVIDAYRIVKKEIPDVQLALIGSFAPDDTQAQEILEDIKKYAKKDKDIAILSNLDGVDSVGVNAFQVASDVVVQKSTKEGFGLTVSEAMWKEKPVIGGRAGGIVDQIVDGETGFLVSTVSQTAEKILYLMKETSESARMGLKGKERVRQKYLITRLLLDHLNLYKELV